MSFFRRAVVMGCSVLAGCALCSAALAGEDPTRGQKSHQFDNNAAISIPVIGTANPYPSSITVAGVNAPIGEVKVVLRGLNQPRPGELTILLVGPAGPASGNVVLMGRVTGLLSTPVTYTFAQDAPALPFFLPAQSGRYRPTREPTSTLGLSAPAPAAPYGDTLNVFKGGLANGVWSLYVIDQFNPFVETGTIAGWSLIIEEAPAAAARGAVAIPAGAPGSTVGPAGPYPAPVLVDGVTGQVQSVSVMLHGLSHTFQSDLRFMLRGPFGQTCLLYSRCGVTGPGWTNADLIFDDAAASFMPTTLAAPGAYKPTICGGSTGNLAAPAPAGPYGTTLSVFNGTSPNGIWELYVEDVADQDSGQLAGGWTLIVNNTVCSADFNRSGGVTIDDLFLYLNAYFTGCP